MAVSKAIQKSGKAVYRAMYQCVQDGVLGTVSLGTFDNRPRAEVAVKLYRLWHRRGFSNVPRINQTIDAI